MSDASHWHWKFCKQCSYDDLLNEALGRFEEAEQLRHKLLAKEDEIEALKKLNDFLSKQVEEMLETAKQEAMEATNDKP